MTASATATAATSCDPRAAAALAASGRSEIESFIVMDVMRAAAERVAAGVRVIHLEVGQPATPAPRLAREAAKRAIDGETLGYTQALGTDALRARIARHYGETYGLDIAPRRVIVTTGSSAGFVLAFLALFDAGDTVLLPSPGYPCYRHILTALGCKTAILTTGPDTGWVPSVGDTAARVRTTALGSAAKGLLLASPANPTGTVISADRLADLAAVCAAHGMWLVSDEIYHGLTYTDTPATTALAVAPDAVVINSFSKYFSMTGWRIGWLIVPERLVRPIERLAQNLFISAPAVSQAAALAAFEAGDELAANRAMYAANRALLLDELPRAGLDHIAPADGAFYLYVDVSHLTDDSVAFARRILDEAAVAVTPGLDFDAARGGRFLRFSYAGSTQDITEAARRIRAWRTSV